MDNSVRSNLILGLCLMISFAILGAFIYSTVTTFKEYQRTVVVKGLSEREVLANRAIWPITFTVATNDLTQLYDELDKESRIIKGFLTGLGFKEDEITVGIPTIVDKFAREFDMSRRVAFRYTANQSVTLCTEDVQRVINGMKRLLELGKKGIVLSGDQYESRPQFLFTKLNQIKPTMIEEATKKARQVAMKFARDSDSKLGKIKRARQGQFSIDNRDENTPYIKKVRVVSTVEYFLVD